MPDSNHKRILSPEYNFINCGRTFTTLLRVRCLHRVSTTAQADHNVIPLPREACQKYAREHGLWITKEYQECRISAFIPPAEDRDTLQKLREDALEKRFGIPLIFMFNWIGRRSDEVSFVVEWFIKHGIRVIKESACSVKRQSVDSAAFLFCQKARGIPSFSFADSRLAFRLFKSHNGAAIFPYL